MLGVPPLKTSSIGEDIYLAIRYLNSWQDKLELRSLTEKQKVGELKLVETVKTFTKKQGKLKLLLYFILVFKREYIFYRYFKIIIILIFTILILNAALFL